MQEIVTLPWIPAFEDFMHLTNVARCLCDSIWKIVRNKENYVDHSAYFQRVTNGMAIRSDPDRYSWGLEEGSHRIVRNIFHVEKDTVRKIARRKRTGWLA